MISCLSMYDIQDTLLLYVAAGVSASAAGLTSVTPPGADASALFLASASDANLFAPSMKSLSPCDAYRFVLPSSRSLKLPFASRSQQKHTKMVSIQVSNTPRKRHATRYDRIAHNTIKIHGEEISAFAVAIKRQRATVPIKMKP